MGHVRRRFRHHARQIKFAFFQDKAVEIFDDGAAVTCDGLQFQYLQTGGPKSLEPLSGPLANEMFDDGAVVTCDGLLFSCARAGGLPLNTLHPRLQTCLADGWDPESEFNMKLRT